MSVGLLVISHNGIGQALLGTATFMMDGCPLQVKVLSASRDSLPDEILEHAKESIEILDAGQGVLILTDLYGSTPNNVAQQLLKQYEVRIVTGLNLSMLLRVLNYPQLALDEMADRAVSGGKEGIILTSPD